MKKIILGILGSMLVLNAGSWSTVSGMFMKEVKPDKKYTLDTVGVNIRVYEWSPLGSKDKLCVLVFPNASDDKVAVPVMQCFKK